MRSECKKCTINIHKKKYNPEKQSKRGRKWYENNKKIILERAKKYYKDNKNKIKIKMKKYLVEYYTRPSVKIRTKVNCHKRWKKIRDTDDGTINYKSLSRLLREQKFLCGIC
jgi:hypothetical protein